MRFLERIIRQKLTEIEALRHEIGSRRPKRDPQDAVRPFAAAIGGGGIIAEVKRRSPSRPDFRLACTPVALARSYERSGAAALSVVTDSVNFGTSLADLADMRRASGLPAISKDFIIDPIQVRAAWIAGADAVLLIARILGVKQLHELLAEARGLGLEALVECHDEKDLEVALAAGADLVGVNNRDLDSLTTDLAAGDRLLPLIPEALTRVAESGLERRADVRRLASAGADAFLIGHSLLLSGDPGRKLRELAGIEPEDRLRVKVCGLTDGAEAAECRKAGADFLGMIFAPGPRHVDERTARAIRRAVPTARLCGVFVDEAPARIQVLAEECGLDLVQLHGREAPDVCAEVADRTGVPVIKALTPGDVDGNTAARYGAARYLLLDQPKDGRDRGPAWDDPAWLAAAGSLAVQGADLFLAGGLGPGAGWALGGKVRPFALDVSRGVEAAPGRKDPALVRDFIREVVR